jgi:predicted site-specific integrase-resolvase
VTNEKLSPQEELANDLVSIMDDFTDKAPGLRKYKKQIEADAKIFGN